MSFYVTSKPATSENRHDRFHVCPPEGSSAAGYDLTHKNLEHAQEILANAREFSKISEGFASKIRARRVEMHGARSSQMPRQVL
jgi:hypothetical protein